MSEPMTPALQVIHDAKLSASRRAEAMLATGDVPWDDMVHLATLWRNLDTQSRAIRQELRLPVRGTEPSWVTTTLRSSYA